MLFTSSDTEQGLDGHQKCRQQNDYANGKCNIRIPLRFLHEIGQTDLTNQGCDKTNDKTNDRVIWHQQAKNNVRRCGCKAGKENHAGGASGAHGWMHAHGKHEWTLDNATSLKHSILAKLGESISK